MIEFQIIACRTKEKTEMMICFEYMIKKLTVSCGKSKTAFILLVTLSRDTINDIVAEYDTRGFVQVSIGGYYVYIA